MFSGMVGLMSHDSSTKNLTIRGRGTSHNPAGRFEHYSSENDAEFLEHRAQEEDLSCGTQVKTQLFTDTTRSIISTNDSPDVGMEASINPYRGCEHGCIYCFARPFHEYLGMSAGVDFETKIFVKPNAAQLLEKELAKPSWKPKVFMLSGVTDCYQPTEKELRLTRSCLEVLHDFRNPATIVTKNYLVTRDIDLLEQMHEWNGISVHMSITTLDGKLARLMEPRASQPLMRFRAIEALAKRGIPTGMIIGPVLPGLTDHEIPALLKSAADAGAHSAHYTMLRLPYGVKDLFSAWIHEHYPDRAERVLNHVRDTRGGKLYESKFGERMVGKGHYAENIADIFRLYKKKYGLNRKTYSALSTEHFRRNARAEQKDLFD